MTLTNTKKALKALRKHKRRAVNISALVDAKGQNSFVLPMMFHQAVCA